ncbi:MAG: hypothetical protein AB7T49_04155 [Oligoflexales bacterium]
MPVLPSSVAIEFDPEIDEVDMEGLQKVCKLFGDLISYKADWWLGGVFADYSCKSGKDLIAGEEPETPPLWALKFETQDSMLSIRFVFKASNSLQNRAEAEYKMDLTPETFKALSTKKVATAIAHMLLDSLPGSFVIPGQLLTRKKMAVTSTDDGFPLPDKLVVFTLKYNKKTGHWLPQSLGHWTLVKDNLYTPPKELPQIDTDARYWAQSMEGRGDAYDDLDRPLDRALIKFGLSKSLINKLLFQTVASGYAGVRYGHPLVQDDPLISKAAMVGVFTEVRGGPLGGLRWYWDVAPEVETEIDGKKVSYTWSRPSLGWSFGMTFENKWIKRIDAVPKLGLMDLDATLPVPDPLEEEEYLTQKVRLKNEMNMGLELGVESYSPWFLIRFWGSSDLSGFVNISKSGSISTLRAGIDTYWDLFKFWIFESSLLVFVSGERLGITFKGDQVIKAIYYQQGFAGMGLTLTW